ncbi:hypothetical protein J43TS3_19500 [Ornithinibacillus bavariensis]|uniref:Uncharacterized protein n=1 Tax=Ornithinibacillus bavariensis TaxID=545502 RepID=A0A920C7M1_9BACI|nr:hypothetical protein J43TS3_19500 [Ornithinibacillus bavariensis]
MRSVAFGKNRTGALNKLLEKENISQSQIIAWNIMNTKMPFRFSLRGMNTINPIMPIIHMAIKMK